MAAAVGSQRLVAAGTGPSLARGVRYVDADRAADGLPAARRPGRARGPRVLAPVARVRRARAGAEPSGPGAGRSARLHRDRHPARRAGRAAGAGALPQRPVRHRQGPAGAARPGRALVRAGGAALRPGLPGDPRPARLPDRRHRGELRLGAQQDPGPRALRGRDARRGPAVPDAPELHRQRVRDRRAGQARRRRAGPLPRHAAHPPAREGARRRLRRLRHRLQPGRRERGLGGAAR